MARPLELALAVAAAPLSLDQLVEWGFARPVELWNFVEAARREGWLAEDDRRPGHFLVRDEARRTLLLEGAVAEEDWAPLVACAALRADLVAGARRLRREHRFRAAAALFRALLLKVEPDGFPNGEAEWVAVLLDSIRMLRQMYGIPPAVLDRALGIAEARGDIATQAVLLAARGFGALFARQPALAAELHARAREAAQAASPAVRTEVYTYLAIGLVTQGRHREAVAALEELLGDVPDDAVANGDHWLLDDSPVAAVIFGYLAHAYCYTGQTPRALELLHRLLSRAEALGRPAIVAEARVHLALVHIRLGSLRARPHAEAAWSFYGADPHEPVYAWVSACARAWVLAAEGDVEGMRRVVEAGLPHRARAGFRFFVAQQVLYDIARRCGAAALEGLAGLDLAAEAEQDLSAPAPHTAGVTHRFLAWLLASRAADPAGRERAAALLERAVALLREAGAVSDLVLALADAASAAQQRGDEERARALRDEERRLRASLPPSPEDDEGARQAQLAMAVLGLGRIDAGLRRDGAWGEIASRLSRGLGAERVAVCELRPAPRVLACRGGDAAWQRGALELAARAGPQVRLEAAPDGTHRVLVPFRAEGSDRPGVAILENRHAPALVGERDATLLSALSAQLGILFDNLALWQELAAARERLEQENRYFRESRATAGTASMVAHAPAMRQLLDLVARVAPTQTPVLVLGETGVGKELVAGEVHRRSARRDGPFIAVHIASMAPGLVASGLFGHERGAFTGATEQQKGRFELAHGGTIFLDEIGELAPEEQVRLLRVLQEGSFERVGGTRPIRPDFRLVAATNRDLEAEVKAGRFRQDLYFRLNVFPVRVPPLRERAEEIPTLALFFMERFARNLGRAFEGISEADMARLCAFPWPGNVRELEHVIERAVLLSDGPRLRIPPLEGAAPPPAPADDGELVPLEEVERRHLARVLRRTGGKITGPGGAAEILGLNPSTLNWRIKERGLRDVLEAVRKERARG